MGSLLLVNGMTVFQMFEEVPPGDSMVLIQSLLALVAFVLVGAALAYDADTRGMKRPGAWGVATFLLLFLGVFFTGNLLPGVVLGVVVIGLYLAVRE